MGLVYVIGPNEMLQELSKLVTETTAATPQATADAFNKRLADAGFDPAGVAAIGQTLAVSWTMQQDMRPEEAISGSLTVGILLGYRQARGELQQ